MIAYNFTRASSAFVTSCSNGFDSSQHSARIKFTSGLSKIFLNYAIAKFPYGAVISCSDFESFRKTKDRNAATKDNRRRFTMHEEGSIDKWNCYSSAIFPNGFTVRLMLFSSPELVSSLRKSKAPFFSWNTCSFFIFISAKGLPPLS